MNQHSFKKIFSKRLGALVAVGEQVKSQGKQPGTSDAEALTLPSPINGRGNNTGFSLSRLRERVG
ncbi:MAG: ESPR domain-containing protein, partial [Methylobacillus sp.]|nr:ESPR domain-containing protein [Methylobacillus sp.]